MQVLTFKIKLLEPTLVVMLGSGDANQVESFGYIPGSVLRSTLAAQYIKRHNLGDKAAGNETCRQLFFNGAVRFLNAYPRDRLGQRTLPTPLSWRAEKGHLADFKEKETTTLALHDFSHTTSVQLEAAKAIPQPFCTLNQTEEKSVEFFAAKKRVAVHNARTTRRVMAQDASALFQYEAVAEGETFAGIILAEDGVDLTPVEQILFESDLTIGKSRSAGYGRIKIEKASLDAVWPEYLSSEDYEDIQEDDWVVITLLSAALVRDQNGTYTTDISHALNVESDKLQRERSFYTGQIVGGFNRKWGLPLPQSLAVQMGSVFVYPSDALDPNKLANFEKNGLGERLADGFGRIAVNWHRYPKLTAQKIEGASKSDPITLSLETHSGQLAQRIVEYQLRREVEVKLFQKIATLDITGSEASRTQLSRVRLAARRALEKKSLAELETFLTTIKGKSAEQTLQRCRVGTQTLHDWLTTHLDPAKIIKTLEWQTTSSPAMGTISIDLTTDQALQIEYTARLVEGVVKREIDKQRQQVRSQQSDQKQAQQGGHHG